MSDSDYEMTTEEDTKKDTTRYTAQVVYDSIREYSQETGVPLGEKLTPEIVYNFMYVTRETPSNARRYVLNGW